MKKDALLFINNKKIGTIDFLENIENGYKITISSEYNFGTDYFLDIGKCSFLVKLTSNENITFDGIINKVSKLINYRYETTYELTIKNIKNLDLSMKVK